MKNKKILSLLLVATMCFSMLVGCGKKEPEPVPADELKALLTEMSTIKEGNVDLNASITIYKDALEKLSETEETENAEDISLGMEPTEALENLVDENGNLKFDMAVNAKYNEEEQVDMTIDIFEEKMNAIVDKETVYIEIDGLFDILAEAIGDEVALIKMFFGEEYEYIKTTTEPEEGEEKAEKEMPDAKNYITAENTTKNENGSYLTKLGNKYIQDCLTDEIKEKLEIETVANSTADLTLLKDGANNKYISSISLNFENMIQCEVSVELAAQDVTIEFPADEKVLDTDDEGNLSLDFGMGEDSDLEVGDVETSEGVDFEWITDDSNDSSSDDYTWEDFDSVELDYDFVSNDTFAFDFVTESADFKDAAVGERYNVIKPQIDTVLSQVSPGVTYDTSTSSDKEWNSYSASYSARFTDFDEEMDLYIADDYVSFETSYYLDKGYSKETLNAVSNRIEELTGLVVPAEELDGWIQNLLSQYKEEYWSMSAYADYDNLEFSIYVWDGEDINISIERFEYSY